jgi:hypothetical protein
MSNDFNQALNLKETGDFQQGTEPISSSSLVRQYQRGYACVRSMLTYTTIFKTIAWLIGLAIIAFFIVSKIERKGSDFWYQGFVVGFFPAALIVWLNHLWAAFYAGRAYMLKATLDHTVATSPYLSDAERQSLIQNKV